MGKPVGSDFEHLKMVMEQFFSVLAVCIFSGMVFMAQPVGIGLCIYLMSTKYFFIPLLYGAWIWYDRGTCKRGGRRLLSLSEFFLTKMLVKYFPIHQIKTAELPLDRNYVFGNHPHGVVCAAPACTMVMNLVLFRKYFPGITTYGLTLSGHFMVPLSREILLSYGACSVDKDSIHYILTQKGTGNAIVIMPGGNAEALEARLNSATLVLKNRKGFVKMALKYGASLVPVYNFGENDIYWTFPNPEGSLMRKIQMAVKNALGIPFVIANGRGLLQDMFGIFPRRKPIYSVVGKPIDVPKEENPSQELIDKYHAIYMNDLEELYNEYKTKFGDKFKNEELVII